MISTTSCGGDESNYGAADTTGTSVAIENIMTRTSVRQYTGQVIPDDTLDIILKAAMAAPSAINKQPWEFVIVKDQTKRDRIGEAIVGVGDKVKTAGAVVLVCGNSERFIEQAPEYWVQDCSAATENLLLAVNALKLGAVWCGVYPMTERVNEVRQILGLPENIIPLNVVTIGYPTAIETPKDKWDTAKIIVI
ncbi:MAG: nitroreductase family protein [Muribaculaceae bacterium]|nr:nitroreductase family protein [Muribaculaceae bacterium]